MQTIPRFRFRFKKNDPSAVNSVLTCLDEVKTWLASNFLPLNEDKVEVITFGPTDNPAAHDINLVSLAPFNSPRVWNLGFLLDGDLKFDKHVSSVVGSSCCFSFSTSPSIKNEALSNQKKIVRDGCPHIQSPLAWTTATPYIMGCQSRRLFAYSQARFLAKSRKK